MGDPDKLALVVKALTIGIRGCVEWHHKEVDRVRDEMFDSGLSPEGIKDALIAFARGGGKILQVKEQREERKNRRDYNYKAILPIPSVFSKGLFVELELVDSDEDYPEVLLVNAHEQK
jgi:hypothetical protein